MICPDTIWVGVIEWWDGAVVLDHDFAIGRTKAHAESIVMKKLLETHAPADVVPLVRARARLEYESGVDLIGIVDAVSDFQMTVYIEQAPLP
jgi:hypothetical protein